VTSIRDLLEDTRPRSSDQLPRNAPPHLEVDASIFEPFVDGTYLPVGDREPDGPMLKLRGPQATSYADVPRPHNRNGQPDEIRPPKEWMRPAFIHQDVGTGRQLRVADAEDLESIGARIDWGDNQRTKAQAYSGGQLAQLGRAVFDRRAERDCKLLWRRMENQSESNRSSFLVLKTGLEGRQKKAVKLLTGARTAFSRVRPRVRPPPYQRHQILRYGLSVVGQSKCRVCSIPWCLHRVSVSLPYHL